MPLYTYHCDSCDESFEVVRTIADMKQEEPCHCGGVGHKIIVAPLVHCDLAGYESPITGERIEGRKAHIEHLKRNRCRVYEAGETQEFLKKKEERQKDFDRRTDQIVEKAARSMGLIR